MFTHIPKDSFYVLIEKYKKIQAEFLKKYNVDDIFSNSKIYEIIIANALNHILIPGHSGSKDAKDEFGNIFEYKHYKETSKNHTWTFNDFSDQTIDDLKLTKSVIFAHIEDKNGPIMFDWYYEISGKAVSEYLKNATIAIKNTRKMINVSSSQIGVAFKAEKKYVKKNTNGRYDEWLVPIMDVSNEIESLTKTKGILTSNKIWEVLIATELDHMVNSEQGGREGAHDACDKNGLLYEYKISKTSSWNFQDISENVLNKYLLDTKIILAVVDKTNIKVTAVFSADPIRVVALLKTKLENKKQKFALKGKELRRLQVSLSKGDLVKISAKKII
jgi:hypothetical protein